MQPRNQSFRGNLWWLSNEGPQRACYHFRVQCAMWSYDIQDWTKLMTLKLMGNQLPSWCLCLIGLEFQTESIVCLFWLDIFLPECSWIPSPIKTSTRYKQKAIAVACCMQMQHVRGSRSRRCGGRRSRSEKLTVEKIGKWIRTMCWAETRSNSRMKT